MSKRSLIYAMLLALFLTPAVSPSQSRKVSPKTRPRIAIPSTPEQDPQEIRGRLVTVSIVVGREGNEDEKHFLTSHSLPNRISQNLKESDAYFRYVGLRSGEKYKIIVRPIPSRFYERYGVAVAVDGLDIFGRKRIADQISRAKTWNSFYILSNWNEDYGLHIEGWRDDNETETEFVVSPATQSVAGLQGNASDAGTIVIAVFREAGQKPVPRPKNDRPAEMTRGGGGEGTSAGDRIRSKVREVEFTSKGLAFEVFIIRYGSPQTLSEMMSSKEASRFWPPR